MSICFDQTPPVFCYENGAYPGVKRVCGIVCQDVERVTGCHPEQRCELKQAKQAVIIGTLGKSEWLRELAEKKLIHAAPIKGKWECFLFQIVAHPFPGIDEALVIAGSDKRGTIFGMFHLSEWLGVSPLVDWAEVYPQPQEQMQLSDDETYISKEPSVKYRGIFLNDEWPALGTWAQKRFGGFNAKFYAHVFELILRLKGNYLWPAMWKSNFSLDGPGLESAVLADELGIVMGTSHHEPCMRSGEEYGLMRGSGSIYGDAWNFRTNREGVLRFWQDGLKRNSSFENYITVGMRGEQDTPIMGKNATLKDNIDLLRDVLKEQNRLIRQQIAPDLDKVKRLFVLFTEVEAFYYGDDNTVGLEGDPELEGVTLMLSDDNFGNLRSLPNGNMQAHKGGLGLYYHLDFHGGAYAYDWMNTNYLPKMWEQLTTAYESGIREVWIANIGDICFLEYPLCYFMDLAYDMDAWGVHQINKTDKWTESWCKAQFASAFQEEDIKKIAALLWAYTRINHNRKPEIMNVNIYHPVHFGETETLLEQVAWIEREAAELLSKCPEKALPSFWNLIYYPAVASANHSKMWLCADRNQFYAHQGRNEADLWAKATQACILKDRQLMKAYHTIGNGRFDGMALSEHVGFTAWCEDGNLYPPLVYVESANKPRLLVADTLSEKYTIGSRWTGDTLYLREAMRQGVEQLRVDLACGSREKVSYTLDTDCPWIRLSHTAGCVSDKDVLTITVDRGILKGHDIGTILVHSVTESKIVVEAENRDVSNYPSGCFIEENGIICMEADGFTAKHDNKDAAFVVLSPYGRTGSAIKVMPPILDYSDATDRPWVEYSFEASQTGVYSLLMYMAPSNTADMRHRLCFGLQMNNGPVAEINGVEPGFRSLDLQCREWDTCVRNNIRIKQTFVDCKQGINYLRIYAGSPLVVFERFVLYPRGKEIPDSYLGPIASWCCK